MFGKTWRALDPAEQENVLDRLINDADEEALVLYLKTEHGLDEDNARSVANCRVAEGYGRLSLKAIGKILPHLKDRVIPYSEAAADAGYNHSDFYTGEWFSALPYYGQILERYTGGPIETSSNADEAKYGRIANPTVHIALNELRKVVNGIIQRYGHPDEIIVEVTRDLKSSQQRKKEIQRRQRENQQNNERYAEELEKLGLRNNYDNRQRFKLWEELGTSIADRKCIFSGERIGLAKLFSPEIEVEHIIPFSRCLDDSLSNKTLATRKANRDKGERTPHEAFGENQQGYSWDNILDRADNLSKFKRERFAPDAAEKFANKDEWLARQLNDTAYISRVARQYLTAICNKNNVYTVPGRLTALLRHSLGLNGVLGETDQKERDDHRHHAVDALVVGLTDRSLLQRASAHSKWAREDGLRKLMEAFPEPWESFHSEAQKSVDSIAVSHKPDHGVEAALHNDTAYGIVEGPDEKGVCTVVYRKIIANLKPKDLAIIRDRNLAERIQVFVDKSGESFEKAVIQFSEETNIHRCRVVEKLSVIQIQDRQGKTYKGYKGDGNYCYEIFESEGGKWDGDIISNFVANQTAYGKYRSDKKLFRSKSFSGKPLVMRVCPNDVIASEDNSRTLLRVAKLTRGKISMVPISYANADARNRDPLDPFKYLSKSPNALRKIQARRVFIDPIGRVKDPGF